MNRSGGVPAAIWVVILPRSIPPRQFSPLEQKSSCGETLMLGWRAAKLSTCCAISGSRTPSQRWANSRLTGSLNWAVAPVPAGAPCGAQAAATRAGAAPAPPSRPRSDRRVDRRVAVLDASPWCALRALSIVL